MANHSARPTAACLVTEYGALPSRVSSPAAETVTGAGASFPAPVYAKWADAYNKATGAKVNYQSIGSGGGIAQIKAATVDFGSSDAPLKPEELAKFGLAQFPSVIGGVVPGLILSVAFVVYIVVRVKTNPALAPLPMSVARRGHAC